MAFTRSNKKGSGGNFSSPKVTPMYNSVTYGSSTYEVEKSGTYLIIVSVANNGTKSIVLPSGRTSTISQDVNGKNNRGMSIIVADLQVGDIITMTNSETTWYSASKMVFLLENFSIASINSTSSTDDNRKTYTTQSDNIYHLVICTALGKTDDDYYIQYDDTKIFTEDVIIKGIYMLCGVFIEKGNKFNSLSCYGYDGGGVFICDMAINPSN